MRTVKFLSSRRTRETGPRIAHSLLALIAVAGLSFSSFAQALIDLAICLDGTGSVSAAEWTIQVDGTGDAIRNTVPADGRVRLYLIVFTGTATTELGPTIITSAMVRDDFATAVEGLAQPAGGTGTNIESCIDEANSEILAAIAATPTSTVQIIDISTDGMETAGDAVAAGAAARTAGIDKINGIFIGTDAGAITLMTEVVCPEPVSNPCPDPDGAGDIVVSGVDGFLIQIDSFDDYEPAFTLKLETELARRVFMVN